MFRISMHVETLTLSFMILQYAESYKILGIFPVAGDSHYILGSKLMKGLAEAGHDVTMISPYKLKNPPKNGTYTDIVLEKLAIDYGKFMDRAHFFDQCKDNFIEKMEDHAFMFEHMTNDTLHHPNVKQLLESNVYFDAVITEYFYNDALKIFAHIYKCPLIHLASHGPKGGINLVVANPVPVAYVPHIFLNDGQNNEMTFIQRATNLIYFIMDYYIYFIHYMPHQEKLLKSAFPHAPSVWDLYSNVSMVLLNSHSSFYQPTPIVPSMVEIGGYHIDPPQKLPKELENFLNSATDGVIYFSMGTNLKISDLPKERFQMFVKVFSRLKQKVLWKLETETFTLPKNILGKNWVPQNDILAHPNVRLFITHAGLLSIMETIYNAVPILAIPVFYDQPMNAQKAVESGFGLQLKYYDNTNFNEKTFSSLIDELLNNPKYKKSAQETSEKFHDRPLKPMENAVYWVEYAIRYRGSEHLRVTGVKLPLYKYLMLDVIIFLLVTIIALFYIIKIIFKQIIYLRKDNAWVSMKKKA